MVDGQSNASALDAGLDYLTHALGAGKPGAVAPGPLSVKQVSGDDVFLFSEHF